MNIKPLGLPVWICIASFGMHGMFGASQVLAQSMYSVAALEQGAVLQQNYANSRVFFERSFAQAGYPDYAFGGSGVLLDPWNVLISGHQVLYGSYDGRDENLRVGTGSNYMNDRGTLVEVANVITHPTWQGQTGDHAWNGNIDLTILHLERPILDAPVLNIAPTNLGEYTVGVGYGRPGLASGQYLDVDGQARAFEMLVERYGNTGVAPMPADYFNSTLHTPNHSTARALSGGGTNGSSGGGVFNQNGDLVALSVAVLGNPPGYLYRTVNLRLDMHREWIYANLQVPAPSTLAFVMMAGICSCRRKR